MNYSELMNAIETLVKANNKSLKGLTPEQASRLAEYLRDHAIPSATDLLVRSSIIAFKK